MTVRNTAQWRYKETAIGEAATAFRAALGSSRRQNACGLGPQPTLQERDFRGANLAGYANGLIVPAFKRACHAAEARILSDPR
jgi:hypothetical protein